MWRAHNIEVWWILVPWIIFFVFWRFGGVFSKRKNKVESQGFLKSFLNSIWYLRRFSSFLSFRNTSGLDILLIHQSLFS
jgi:hypothetical protein